MSKYISEEHLFNPEEKVLLTVSGGVDSMVMTELFRQSEYNFSVAHCNFQLRGEESDGDEIFVREYCKKHNIPIFVKHFNTKEYAVENGISIQMAARDLRYEWFEELCDSEGFECYATAHHKDDEIETFFINLMRGTGIAGLHGILPRQGRVIRPLLFAGRYEIEEYAKKINLKFREDSSNSEVKYLRNSIRHRLLPVLKEIHPGYIDTLTGNIERLRETEKIYRKEIERVKKEILVSENNLIKISIPGLENIETPKILLFEILSEYGFNGSQVEDIFKSIDSVSGKSFYSGTHILIKDRNEFIISQLKDNDEIYESIYSETTSVSKPVEIKIRTIKKDAGFKINKDSSFAYLDKEKLSFPLKIRKWMKGDFFYPLGMTSKKKVSDFFIDEKISVIEKKNSFILVSGDDIVWIIGYRIDNRFKISEDTKEVLLLEIRKQNT
jgi:tRNA(Ile)-lysidine synthase